MLYDVMKYNINVVSFLTFKLYFSVMYKYLISISSKRKLIKLPFYYKLSECTTFVHFMPNILFRELREYLIPEGQPRTDYELL